jgi:6-phosphogluconolactonase
MSVLERGFWRVACRDDGHAAGEAARVILDAFVRARERQFAVALSGGRIAPRLYAELVAQSARRGTLLGDAEFFFADERCVPADHAEANYRVARTSLFEPLGASGAKVHRLEGELAPEVAEARANADWQAFLVRRGRASGCLDCVVLGVGEDGHVASLFPGNMEQDLERSAAFRAVLGPKPPPQRLTMGYPLLWEARRVVILATGAGKESVLTEAVRGGTTTPLGRVIAGRRGRETVLVTPLKVG